MKRSLNWLLFTIGRFLLRVPYTLVRAGLPRLNNLSAEYIIWAPHFWTPRFLVNDNLPRSLAVYSRLKQRGHSVALQTDKRVGRLFNKKVIFFLSERFDSFNFSDYTAILQYITQNLERQGNTVFPSSYEVKFWENKAFMHEVFAQRKVRTPNTIVIPNDHNNLKAISELNFPLLVKEEHSYGSKGVHLVRNWQDFRVLIEDELFYRKNRNLILQQLLNIRRDLRVILVGKEIVWHYWRINLAQEWRPTATSHGNRVDFGNFPEEWRSWIVEMFEKLEIITGAFDIAWENDNIKGEPYILEVSPVYQPNPKPRLDKHLINYGSWKKSLSFPDNYHLAYIDLEFFIQSKLVDELLRRWK